MTACTGLPHEGAKYVCAPPLRKQEDSACLWKALADGTIQTVSTDHCSFTTEQKALGKDDFTKIPGGMPGVETRGTLLYTYGVDAGRITKVKNVPAFVGKSRQAVRNVSHKGSHCPGEATRTLLSCAPVWRIWLRLRTRYRMWITLPLREGS